MKVYGTYELPDNEHFGYGQVEYQIFDGPHEGELIEFHQDYLQWMTIAQKRIMESGCTNLSATPRVDPIFDCE